jgi:hypothetical protein
MVWVGGEIVVPRPLASASLTGRRQKGIFFIFYQQTSNLRLTFSFAWNSLRDLAKIVALGKESK